MKTRSTVQLGIAAAGIALALVAAACKPADESASSQSTAAVETVEVVAAPDSPVLARVDGSVITQADLERALAQSLGPAALRFLDDRAKHQVLKGLVLNRAMSHQVQAQLEPERQRQIDAAVAAYRETLLAREFMRIETQDVQLSEAMVEAYYQEHPAEFGQQTVRHYELLKGRADTPAEDRAAILARFGEVDANTSWSEFALQQRVRDAGITFFRGELVPDLFEPRVQNLIAALGEGEVSEVVFFDRVPYRVRISELETTDPQPFEQVRDRALERVKASTLKQAIAGLREDVLARADVEYLAKEATP